MKKIFWLMGLVFSSVAAASSEFPIERLKGLFVYQSHFQVPTIRRAETVSSETTEGRKRIAQLRSEGYACIRKNPETRICSKIWKPAETPTGLADSVDRFMQPIRLQFEGSSSAPVLVHDGSTSQEWEIREAVQVLEKNIGVYRVIRSSQGAIYIAFPVSEDQPMNPLLYRAADELVLSLIANVKDTETSTTAYTIEASLEKRP